MDPIVSRNQKRSGIYDLERARMARHPVSAPGYSEILDRDGARGRRRPMIAKVAACRRPRTVYDHAAMTDSTASGRMRGVRPRVSRTACRLAAALLATAAAGAGQTAGAAAVLQAPKGSSRDVQTEAAVAPAARAERHSPRTGYPSLGPAGAANTLIFFTDYQCPVCPRAARELDRLVESFNGTLRVELHHNPLVMHKQAYDAAAAAKAAQRQGKFWEYHEELLKSRSFSRETLIGIAAGLGLDREAFIRDFDDPKLRLEVTAEAKQAYEADALGTPGFLINGHVEVGWASLPWLEGVVRAHSR